MPKNAPPAVHLPDDVWNRSEVLDLCRAQDANGLFRVARKNGATNESIGYWTGIDPVEISKRILGKKGPVRALDRWQRIADGLGMPDHACLLLGLAPPKRSAGSRQSSALVRREHPLTRQLMTPPVRLPMPDNPMIDPHFPATLLDLLSQYSHTDNLLGPRSLLLAVTSQLALVEQLLKAAREPVRSQLFEVGARYSEFAGWLYQDAGDFAAAARWTQQALELAHAAGSPVLTAYVLMRRSNQESTVGNGARALSLAAAALDLPQVRHPQLAALALRQRARGYALDGDALQCERALDDARAHVASMPDDPDPLIQALAGYCTPSYVEMEAADCWLLLGRPERAVPIFEAELASWPNAYRRDRAVHLARLTSAYAACHRVDDAERTAVEALVMAEQIGSSRVTDELGRSLDLLDEAGDCSELGEVRDRLSALTASSSVP